MWELRALGYPRSPRYPHERHIAGTTLRPRYRAPPAADCWRIYYGDMRVGVIALATGKPDSTKFSP